MDSDTSRFIKKIMDNRELQTVVKFLNTYLDDTGKEQLGHCISMMYRIGYEDCLQEMGIALTSSNT